MKLKINPITFLFITLALTSLACTIFVGGPEYPANPLPFSADAVEGLRLQIEQAMITGAETGVVTLQIDENQLTSYLTLKLQEQTNPPFTDPQVFLRDGQMQIYGKIQRGIFMANMLITLNVTVDETGKPKIEIASADFGPFPAPEGLNSAISSVIDEAFTGSLGPVAIGFRLETITIADGIMTLTGRIK
ncbi:MAG: hypothetical protein HZB19_09940 [Chloroflexi bacterium]|nr:hypothetical protein [Chloroflexota bacterium]